MKTPAKQQPNRPKSLAALDFEILCKSQGLESAIKVMLIADALRKEREGKHAAN